MSTPLAQTAPQVASTITAAASLPAPQAAPPVSVAASTSTPQAAPPVIAAASSSTRQVAPPVSGAASLSTPQVAPPVSGAASLSTPQVAPPVTLTASLPTPQIGQSAAYSGKKVATQQGATNISARGGSPPKISRQAAKLASAKKSDSPSKRRIESPAPASHDQQYREPDSSIAWHSWQELPANEVKIRTGERFLGGGNWGHYLTFELAPKSQKVVKISSIHLQGETAPDRELSPTAPDALVSIVNHQRTAGKGLWGWALQADPQDTGSPALVEQGLHNAPAVPPTVEPGLLKPFLQPESVTWHGWQQLAGYDVAIRTGDHYLGGGSWAHYLGFQLAPTSQKVVKVSLIHLEGETAADTELSPTAHEAVVKIVNHHMTEERGAWGWALREIKE